MKVVGIIGLLCLTALSIGCGSQQPPSEGRTETNEVDLPRSYLFSPDEISVQQGTTVTWTNSDQFTHSVRFVDNEIDFDEHIEPGEQVTFTFADAGLYRYDCSLHPKDMTGSVLVTG